MANILVIDDEKSIRFSLHEFLKASGHNVFTADDAFTALDILKKSEIELIISDILLPRIKGTDLLFTIHAVYPQIKTILITGQPNEDSAELGKAAGAYAYLIKPVTKDKINKTVAEVLATK